MAPPQKLTLQQLQAQGAKLEPPSQQPQRVTLAELKAQGAQPQPVEPLPGSPTDKSTAGGAFVHGLGNTFGTGDVLGAAMQADLRGIANIPDVVTGKLGPIENLQSMWDEYRKAREENRYLTERAKETQPGAYYGGKVTGALASAPVLGASAIPAAAGLGAVQGGVEGAAQAKEGEMLPDALQGAAFGGAFGAAGAAAGQFVGQRVAPWVSNRARELRTSLGRSASIRALKASGAIQKDLTAMARRSPEQVYRTGQTLLDEGAIGFGDTVEDVGQTVNFARNVVNDARVAALRDADNAGVPFDMGRFLARAEQEIIHPNIDDPVIAGELDAVRDLLDGYSELGPVAFSRANQLKSRLQGRINWGNNWNLNGPTQFLNDFQTQLQRIFHEEIDDQIEQAAGPATRAAFQEAKRRLGPLIYASDRARQGFAREIGNDLVGIKDMQAAQGALSAAIQSGQATPSGLAMAAGAAAANKYLTGRGSSMSAVTLNAAAGSNWLQSLVETTPQALGDYGAILSSALQRGPAAFAVQDYVLSQQDPKYRQQKEDAQRAVSRMQ